MAFNNRPAKAKVFSKLQAEMWERLHAYIQMQGGWIVSLPDCKTIRFECGLDSDLPNKLRSAGHPVRSLGTHERLTPVRETIKDHSGTTVTREQVGVGVVGVWTFDLPSLDPPKREGRLEIT
jgi:hypothetical protein